MNIKEHIEAGHYPKDEKGRALVPTSDSRTVRVYATDAGESHPIIGVFAASWDRNAAEPQTHPMCWGAAGTNSFVDGHVGLLPPPPRKVKVTRWAALNERGQWCNSGPSRESLRNDEQKSGFRIVELTGEYEEPWPEAAQP